MAAGVTRTLGAAALLATAGVGWSLIEARSPTVRRVTVPVLAPGERPLRLLHLSDLHLVPSQRWKVDWVRSLADLGPDLVIDTGDHWARAEALGPLLGLPGAFVLGSNDYYAAVPKNPARYLRPGGPSSGEEPSVELPARALVELLRSGSWVDLTNRRATLTVDGRDIGLVGTDDAHLGRDVMPPPEPEPGRRVDLRLGVTHAPYLRMLDRFRADGAELVIAGHTHGGQLCVPGWGALVTNCDLDTGRAKGLHGWPGPRPDADGGEDSVWLHVSAGVGTSPYTPVRFACRPEATLLTLVGA